MIARADLPQEVEALKDIILEQQAVIAQLNEQLEKLQHQLDQLLRHRYGQRSEKQRDLRGLKKRPSEGSSSPHGRKPLPKDLPRERVIHDITDEQKICAACKNTLQKMGEDVSEQLEFIPAKLKVIEHIRFKYACKCCAGQVVLADLPFQPIDKGLPGPGLLAHTLISKYQDHLPLHRQEQMYARQGIELCRSTLCDWVKACSHLALPLLQELKRDLFGSPKVHSDDTTMPVLQKGKTHTGRLWVYIGVAPLCTIYEYTRTRNGEHPQRFLAGYEGYLQADAFGGYDALYKTGTIIEVACWAHARRKFEEIAQQSSQPGRADEALQWIRKLYEVEWGCEEKSAAERYAARQAHSRPLLEGFKQWLDQEQPKIAPKSPLAQAMGYVPWGQCCPFLSPDFREGCRSGTLKTTFTSS